MSRHRFFVGQGGSGGGGGIQPVDELPVPSAEWEGKFVEYQGTIYKCVKRGDSYVWEPIGVDPPAANFIYSITVDESNPDPAGACVYGDDCVGFTPASKNSYGSWESFVKTFFKPCVIRNTDSIGSPNYYLNHDNRNFKINGDPAILTGADGDVMTEVAPLWYNFERNGSTYKLSISDTKVGLEWECFNWVIEDGNYVVLPYIYIGEFWGTAASGINSVVGSPSNYSETTPAQWRQFASAKGVGYGNLDYRRYLLLQCMYLLLGKSRAITDAFGTGNDRWITSGANTTQKFISENVFLGIEYLYKNGSSRHYIDRAIQNVANTIRWTDDRAKYGETTAATASYENNIDTSQAPRNYVLTAHGTNRGGFLPKTTGSGSTTTYYCGEYDKGTSPPYKVLGFSYFNNTGFASLLCTTAFSHPSGCSRLVRYK